mgnify:FL=1
MLIIRLMKCIFRFMIYISLSIKNTLYAFFIMVKKVLTNVHKLVCKLCEKILLKIYTVKFRYIVLVYLIIFLIGRLIALKEDFEHSLIHQIDLTIISLIGLYMLQYLHETVSDTRNIMLGICPYISDYLGKLTEKRVSALNIILPIIPVLSFSNKMLKLNYVPISLTGFYALFMAASAFYIALVCYWQLILSTKTIYTLAHMDYNDLPFVYPNDLLEIPDWIKKLTNIYIRTQFSFFTVGTLFTAEYIMLMPDNIEIIDLNGNLNLNLSFDFWSTWIVIFVFIIIAFPIFWILLKRLYVMLATNLSKKASQQLLLLNINPTNDVTSLWSYYQMQNTVLKFETRLFPKRNFYPLIATSVSFILNLAKLFELLKLPLFGSTI